MSDSLSMLEAIARGQKVEENAGVQRMMLVAPSHDCGSDFKPAPTVNNNIDANNLILAGKDVISFTVTNGAAAPRTLILGGGLVGTTGIPAFFGIANAGVDDALVVDDFGAGAAKMDLFSRMTNGHAWIANKITVVGASAAQVVQPITPFRLTPNGDFKRVAGMNTKVDSNLNYAVLEGCPTLLNFFAGALYILGAAETVTIEVEVLGVATIENFANGLK